MAKIGRNEPCFCGSGKKYKKCCMTMQVDAVDPLAGDNDEVGAPDVPATDSAILAAVDSIKQAATVRQRVVRTSGVLILFATEAGDAWLLEATDQDALQLVDQGKEIDVSIEVSPETTTVEWSHTFKVKKDDFVVTSYKDKGETVYRDYPVKKIVAAVRGIKKRIPAAMAGALHVPAA